LSDWLCVASGKNTGQVPNKASAKIDTAKIDPSVLEWNPKHGPYPRGSVVLHEGKVHPSLPSPLSHLPSLLLALSTSNICSNRFMEFIRTRPLEPRIFICKNSPNSPLHAIPSSLFSFSLFLFIIYLLPQFLFAKPDRVHTMLIILQAVVVVSFIIILFIYFHALKSKEKKKKKF
jgi:hypothetical protein